MSTPAISYSGPSIDPSVPFEVRRHLQLFYTKLANHTQAFQIQQAKIDSLKSGSTTTVFEGGSGGGSTPSSVTGIAVNNQSGVTSYATQSGDDGALIVFSDVSPIAVSLTTQSPPWSVFLTNQSALGTGTVTLAPATGTINGAATLAILPSYVALVCFDGTNWFAATLPIVPVTTGAVAHEWLNSYNGTTGSFTQTQPAFGDISGIATAAQVPVLSALSGAITASQLPADVPVVSFGSGVPSGSSMEGYLYFDTSASPAHGYVFHSSAWVQFS